MEMIAQLRKVSYENIKKTLHLIDEEVTYWYLRKVCSPYNQQIIRVVRDGNNYKLTVVHHSYGDYKIGFHKILFYNIYESMNDTFLLTKDLSYINQGFGEVLYNGRTDGIPGSVEIRQVDESEFNTMLQSALDNYL